MDYFAFIEDPPEGMEQLAFSLRQAAARVDQLSDEFRKHTAKTEQLQAQLNHAAGAADALKSLTSQMISARQPAEDAGDDNVPR